MSRRHEQTFLQRRHTNGQQTHEKKLNITQHQGNTNPNHNETTSHQSEWLKLTSQEMTDVGEDAEKGEVTVGNVSWCSHSGKRSDVYSKS